MIKLAPVAAVLVAAAGAWAQECPLTCSEEKSATQTVAQSEKSCDAPCTEGAAVQTVAMSGEDCGGCDEPCMESCEEGASVQTVAFPADMPKMSYCVGEKETSCSMEASELASQCEMTQVGYKVAGKTYECQVEAGKAYAKELHSYLDRITRVSFVVDGECVGCPVQADELASSKGTKVQYKVGNQVFECADKAIRASAMAYGMAQQVKLGHAVNGEATACSDSFAKAKACSETKATYLVGSKQTECEVEASCLLEMAKIEAALGACQMVAGQG